MMYDPSNKNHKDGGGMGQVEPLKGPQLFQKRRD